MTLGIPRLITVGVDCEVECVSGGGMHAELDSPLGACPGERVGELAWPHRVALPNCALVVASAALRFRV